MKLKRKKFTPLITFFIFLAFTIEPWNQSPLGYVALKSLRNLLGKKKRLLELFKLKKKKEYGLCIHIDLFISSEHPNILCSSLISLKIGEKQCTFLSLWSLLKTLWELSREVILFCLFSLGARAKQERN